MARPRAGWKAPNAAVGRSQILLVLLPPFYRRGVEQEQESKLPVTSPRRADMRQPKTSARGYSGLMSFRPICRSQKWQRILSGSLLTT